MNTLLKALLSPRFKHRNPESKTEAFVKAGDIVIVDPGNRAKECGQKVHMKLVRENSSLTAKFYTDSTKMFCLGTLSVGKCYLSRSSSDLAKIKVTKRDDERFPSPGLLIKTKSEEDALRWIESMSPKEQYWVCNFINKTWSTTSRVFTLYIHVLKQWNHQSNVRIPGGDIHTISTLRIQSVSLQNYRFQLYEIIYSSF